MPALVCSSLYYSLDLCCFDPDAATVGEKLVVAIIVIIQSNYSFCRIITFIKGILKNSESVSGPIHTTILE